MRWTLPAALVFLLCAALPVAAQPRSVALTFDDLPLAGPGGAAGTRRVSALILAALAHHHAPAIAFVIQKRAEETGPAAAEVLAEWLRQGHQLGNHTYSHADLNNLTVAQFEQELIRGEAGRAVRYLRFPYNHTGDTQAKHDAVAALLARRGYRIATCTIENSDWQFAKVYVALQARHDEPTAARLRTEYLAYTAAEIDYYTALHQQVFGHEIPHVMLLHANALNAELIEPLLTLFEQRGYRFVTLDEAQADAAYQTPDTFVTRFGPMWGYRWARERAVKVDGRQEPEPPAWIANFAERSP